MSEYSETFMSLYTKYLMSFPKQLLIRFPLWISNLIQDLVSGTKLVVEKKDLPIPFHYFKFSFNLIRKNEVYRERNLQSRRLRMTKRKFQEYFSYVCFCELYPKSRVGDFESFVEATPGFELGKKDLQSPALPLGHAA